MRSYLLEKLYFFIWAPFILYAFFTGHPIIALLLLLAQVFTWRFVDMKYGTPTLQKAALRGDVKKTQTLLEKGVDVNAADKEGLIPLICAAQEGHTQVAELLIKNGARIDITDKDGITPLHHAAGRGHIDMARFLLSNSANINFGANNSATPLHAAVLEGQKDMVEFLVAAGAEITAEDKSGKTPLRWAEMQNKKEIVDLLRSKGAGESARPVSSDIKIETSQVIENSKPSVRIDFSHIPGDHKLTIKEAAQAIGVGQGIMKDYVKSGRVKVNPDNTIDVAEIRRAGFIIREMPTHKV